MDNELKTVRQFCKRNDAFSEGSVRWIILRSSDQSDSTYSRFRPAIHRIGRKVLIDEPKFLAIVRQSAFSDRTTADVMASGRTEAASVMSSADSENGNTNKTKRS